MHYLDLLQRPDTITRFQEQYNFTLINQSPEEKIQNNATIITSNGRLAVTEICAIPYKDYRGKKSVGYTPVTEDTRVYDLHRSRHFNDEINRAVAGKISGDERTIAISVNRLQNTSAIKRYCNLLTAVNGQNILAFDVKNAPKGASRIYFPENDVELAYARKLTQDGNSFACPLERRINILARRSS